MFDEDYIPDRLDEYYPWRPLTARPLYSQQNVDPLDDQQTTRLIKCQIID